MPHNQKNPCDEQQMVVGLRWDEQHPAEVHSPPSISGVNHINPIPKIRIGALEEGLVCDKSRQGGYSASPYQQ